MPLNMAAGALKFALGMLTLVAAFCISGMYSFFCGIAKRIYFSGMRFSYGDVSRECGYYLAMGMVLVVSSLLNLAYMLKYSLSQGGVPSAAAAVSVCVVAAAELVSSLSGLARARRDGDLLMEGLRFVGLSAALSAAASAFAAIISAVYPERGALYSGMSGAAAGFAGALAGVFMTIKGAVLRGKFAGRIKVRVIEYEERSGGGVKARK